MNLGSSLDDRAWCINPPFSIGDYQRSFSFNRTPSAEGAEKERFRDLELSHQSPATKVRANSSSPLKWT